MRSILGEPAVQQRAYEEIQCVVGPHRLPDFSDRPHLPYIEAVTREVFRFHPSAPLGKSPFFSNTLPINIKRSHAACTDGGFRVRRVFPSEEIDCVIQHLVSPAPRMATFTEHSDLQGYLTRPRHIPRSIRLQTRKIPTGWSNHMRRG